MLPSYIPYLPNAVWLISKENWKVFPYTTKKQTFSSLTPLPIPFGSTHAHQILALFLIFVRKPNNIIPLTQMLIKVRVSDYI